MGCNNVKPAEENQSYPMTESKNGWTEHTTTNKEGFIEVHPNSKMKVENLDEMDIIKAHISEEIGKLSKQN